MTELEYQLAKDISLNLCITVSGFILGWILGLIFFHFIGGLFKR